MGEKVNHFVMAFFDVKYLKSPQDVRIRKKIIVQIMTVRFAVVAFKYSVTLVETSNLYFDNILNMKTYTYIFLQ